MFPNTTFEYQTRFFSLPSASAHRHIPKYHSGRVWREMNADKMSKILSAVISQRHLLIKYWNLFVCDSPPKEDRRGRTSTAGGPFPPYPSRWHKRDAKATAVTVLDLQMDSWSSVCVCVCVCVGGCRCCHPPPSLCYCIYHLTVLAVWDVCLGGKCLKIWKKIYIHMIRDNFPSLVSYKHFHHMKVFIRHFDILTWAVNISKMQHPLENHDVEWKWELRLCSHVMCRIVLYRIRLG